MTYMKHQTERASGASQHCDQDGCAQQFKEPTLGASPARFRGADIEWHEVHCMAS